MGWPYEFVGLTDAQKQHRRVLLDSYGLVAQASAGIVLILVQLYFLAQWLRRQRNASDGLDIPGSPGLKSSQKGRRIFNTRLAAHWWRRLAWWFGDSVTVAGIDLGTNGLVAASTAWTIWLLCLCFAETGNDYLHLTKRFGIVGASQLPLHYLLIWKSSWSPIQILTRASHETLNMYHQALGRIITLLVFLHAAFYLNFYVQSNILGNKLKEIYVLCGIAGAIAFAAIGTTSLSPVRRWGYRMFYIVHVILATALLPVLFFHVHHIRIYLYETVAVYALNNLIRWMLTESRHGTVRPIPNTSLVEISIPTTIRSSSRLLFTHYRPGQHAYVSLPGLPFLRTFRSNPLTAVSIPSIDRHLKFVARALDGNTKKLAMRAEKASTDAKVEINVEGPHGVNALEDRLLQYDRVLFVAGGVGATFVLPLYRQLLTDLSPGKGSYRRQKVMFVWIAKSKAEISWAVPTDQREREGFVERLKICLTNDTSTLGVGENGMDYNDGVEPGAVDGDGGIELEEQKQLLADEVNPTTANHSDLSIYTGRPDLRRLVHQALSHGSNERVAIITCGPKSLSQNLRREIAPWIKRGRDVWFHDESFSL